jgi:predicted dehydrogenase
VTRIGIIGLGTIGETHLAALRQLHVQHVFGADPSAAARARVSAYVGHCFADYREMLSSADLDGVVVATPPRTHREIAVSALDAGLGVLCEKPLAVTIEDCDAISAAVARARGPFQVGFCHRFQPQVRALRSLLDSDAIGRPVLVNISFIHGLSEEGRQWITNADLAGGGVLFDSGSHAIDLFRHLAGEIDEVQGLTAVLNGGNGLRRVEDSSIVGVRSGDVLGTIGLSWKTPPWQGLVEVIGTTGRARVVYDGDRVVLKTRMGDEPWRAMSTPRVSRFVSQMRHFLACVRGKEEPLARVQDGLEATRIVLRIYDQLRTRPSGQAKAMAISRQARKTG